MSETELSRLDVIRDLDRERLTVAAAAELLAGAPPGVPAGAVLQMPRGVAVAACATAYEGKVDKLAVQQRCGQRVRSAPW